jgi:hypothetical protein
MFQCVYIYMLGVLGVLRDPTAQNAFGQKVAETSNLSSHDGYHHTLQFTRSFQMALSLQEKEVIKGGSALCVGGPIGEDGSRQIWIELVTYKIAR